MHQNEPFSLVLVPNGLFPLVCTCGKSIRTPEHFCYPFEPQSQDKLFHCVFFRSEHTDTFYISDFQITDF